MAHLEPVISVVDALKTTAGARGLAVKLSSGAYVDCDAGAGSIGDLAMGFLLDAVEAGKQPTVAVPGGGAVGIAAGDINKGDLLKTNADGHLVATTTTGNVVVAIADDDAADNDVFAIRPTVPFTRS